MLTLAKKTAPKAQFLKQDLRHLDFPADYINGIWACASLLHIKRSEVPVILAKFYEILKPGGILFVHVKKGEG
jgi:ubiquinone/menaquinone biosynthesis C-methylase UbiE